MDFRKSKNQLKANRLEVSDDGGRGYIDLKNILYIQRINRKATAFTQNGAFKVKHSLQELEELLFVYNFFRISRSVIVNLEYFKNYSFWENDKYVFRLHSGQEFVFSRDRLSDLRVKLKCNVTN